MTSESTPAESTPVGPIAVEGRAFARAGLLGNPSDGYLGRTLSVILRDFEARVALEESSEIVIAAPGIPPEVYHGVDHLVESVSLAGYRGESGISLVAAAIKVFHDYCTRNEIPLEDRGFSALYRTSIPRQVGLGGSSAIATAAFRALMALYQVDVPREAQIGLIMSAEVDELGGVAGPQDRVIQVFEGLVYMDFSLGLYESLDPALLPPLYLAYWPEGAEASQRVHGDLRARWEAGEVGVGKALDQIAALATRGREALLAGDHEALAHLMNENLDLRRRVMDVAERDVALVERARALGASAKLPGSGGAIVGTCADDAMRQEVGVALEEMGAVVIEPRVLPRGGVA